MYNYQRKQKMRVKFLIGTIIVLVICAIGYKYTIPTFGNYSEGERSGILQKISHKGFFIKTFEGELATEGIKLNTSGNSSVFEFSVIDQNVVKQLDSLAGKSVTLTYQEKWHVNAFQGNTDYIVTAVKLNKP